MKIYISVDMEGMGGTFGWKQEETDRAQVRKYMAQQLEWVVEGIKASPVNGKIEEILVADSHSGGDNLFYDVTAIDERLYLISGSPRPQYMMPALNSTYDVVFFVGYHGGGGVLHAAMDHTYTSCFQKIRIQDRPMSEALINAAYAGYRGVPVGLVIGDEALGKDLRREDAMPWARYVTTKWALSRYAVKQKPQALLRRETVEAVKAVLASDFKKIPLYKFEPPIKLTIEFQTTVMADVVAMMPCVKRLDGRTIELTHEDYKVVFDSLEVIGILARSVK